MDNLEKLVEDFESNEDLIRKDLLNSSISTKAISEQFGISEEKVIRILNDL